MADNDPRDYKRFSLAERDRRWAAVRALMERDGIDVIIAPPNNGNSTDWQADARYLSHCGGGADASIGCVFPLNDPVTVVATSAVRWGPRVQDWVEDVREADRAYGVSIAERLRELNADGKRIGVCGLAGGTRTPEGTIFHGTYDAIDAHEPVVLMPWGGSSGPALEAFLSLKEMEYPIGWRFTMFLNPLPPKLLEDLREKELVIVPELNYQGQFSAYLRAQGVKAVSITQYTGLPFKVSKLVSEIRERVESHKQETVAV